MKLTIEQVLSKLENKNEWTITVICPALGAIIVVNNAFTTPIFSYRKDESGVYQLDKCMPYNDAVKAPLTAMISAHNNSADNQIEAEKFDLYK
jgi:hypothetical protein